MKFDWYQATLNSQKDNVFSALQDDYAHCDLRPGRPSNGYTDGADLIAGDDVILRLMWGGVNGSDSTHCVSTGSNAPRFAEFARTKFKDHQVSRLDVAADYEEKGCFKDLSTSLIKYAKSKRLKTAVGGDWIKHIGGRTLYLGSRTSPAYLRCYEKGKQIGMDANPDWTRVELEVKPSSKEGKALLATTSLEACWGASRWSIDVAAILGRSGIQRAPIGSIHSPSDHDRAIFYMLKQYGPTLLRQYGLVGEDYALLGQYLIDAAKAHSTQSVADLIEEGKAAGLLKPPVFSSTNQMDLFNDETL
ncbi:MAG: replication initiation factor domain-containing protein [Sulfuricurvum sp.]|nr:replication initiation factor domain-containing protein [Sulfuricurvum sp.]